jgi:hypothetical protein
VASPTRWSEWAGLGSGKRWGYKASSGFRWACHSIPIPVIGHAASIEAAGGSQPKLGRLGRVQQLLCRSFRCTRPVWKQASGFPDTDVSIVLCCAHMAGQTGKAGGDGERNRTCLEPVRCPFGLRPPGTAAPSHASAVPVGASSREAAISPTPIRTFCFFPDTSSIRLDY